jgi:hypothetical protein
MRDQDRDATHTGAARPLGVAGEHRVFDQRLSSTSRRTDRSVQLAGISNVPLPKNDSCHIEQKEGRWCAAWSATPACNRTRCHP